MTGVPKVGRLSMAHAVAKLALYATQPDADPHLLAGRLRACADWLVAGLPPKAPRASRGPVETTADMHAVWSYYCSTFRRTAAIKLTEERARLIKDRLADGMTVDRMKRAIDGLKASPFHRGENDRQTRYQEIEHVFRTIAQAEQLANNAPAVKDWLRKPDEPEKKPEPPADPETAREKAAELARVIGRIGKAVT